MRKAADHVNPFNSTTIFKEMHINASYKTEKQINSSINLEIKCLFAFLVQIYRYPHRRSIEDFINLNLDLYSYGQGTMCAHQCYQNAVILAICCITDRPHKISCRARLHRRQKWGNITTPNNWCRLLWFFLLSINDLLLLLSSLMYFCFTLQRDSYAKRTSPF